jgi:Bacterial antitoxin of type II TA system, VapB
MLRHMRTSIDVPDALLDKARRVARSRGSTLRELVIEGLRAVLERQERAPRFRLRDASYGQGGLVDGVDESDWEAIRGTSYEGRGG